MSDDEALPPGWVEVPLGTLAAESRSIIDPRKSPSEEFELYSIPAYPTRLPEIIAGSSIGSAKQQVATGTVLLGRINPRINRVWVVGQQRTRRQIASTEWLTFPPTTVVKPEYLAYYFRRQAFRRLVANNVSGVGGSLMRLQFAAVASHPVPVAPEYQQSAIVDALDSYCSRLDEAATNLVRAQRNIARLSESILQAAIDGRLVPTEAELARATDQPYEPAAALLSHILAERRRVWTESSGPERYQEPLVADASALAELPEGWCWVTLDQLLREPLRNGISAPTSPTGTIRILTLTAVTQREFTIENTKLADLPPERVDDVWLETDDILIERSNTPELVGTAALYRGPRRFACFPDLLIRVRLLDPVAVGYIDAVLRSRDARTYFRRAAQGMSGTMPKISQETITKLMVPFPPAAEQRRIVHALAAIETSLNSSAGDVTVNSRRVASLRSAVLNAAFAGRLVDQDPSDEPASGLLDRIRAERAATTAARLSRSTPKPKRKKRNA